MKNNFPFHVMSIDLHVSEPFTVKRGLMFLQKVKQAVLEPFFFFNNKTAFCNKKAFCNKISISFYEIEILLQKSRFISKVVLTKLICA